jgi:hypothetical protein
VYVAREIVKPKEFSTNFKSKISNLKDSKTGLDRCESIENKWIIQLGVTFDQVSF